MKRALSISNVCISFVIWLPQILRIAERGSSADVSIASLLLVLWLQLSSLAIAYLDRSRSLLWYFGINALNVAAALAVVVHYR